MAATPFALALAGRHGSVTHTDSLTAECINHSGAVEGNFERELIVLTIQADAWAFIPIRSNAPTA
jgi:hypothetical protein